MIYRVTHFFFPTLMLALFVGAAVARNSGRDENPREGTVVHATATQLVMLARSWEVQAGKTYRYGLAPNAKVTCDGMLCNLQDLTPGQRVRVTARVTGERLMASWVEAIDEQSAFPIAVARAR